MESKTRRVELPHSLAGERTALSEDRTILANERTFAGWMRTGMAAVGIGVGFHALFFSIQPWWIPRAIATIFLLIGIFIVIAAERRACRVTERLDPHVVIGARSMNLKLVTWAMTVATLALVASIWLLDLG